MSRHQAETDPQLLARLAELLARVEPVTEEVVTAARGSFAWRGPDADLAELVYDSAVDEDPLVGVRGGGSARQLTFEGQGLTVDMEVASPDRRVVGQLVPPRAARIELRHPKGSRFVDTDDHGRFQVDGLPHGPVSLRCRPADAPDAPGTTTDWLVI